MKYKVNIDSEFCGTEKELFIEANNDADAEMIADEIAYLHMLEMYDDILHDESDLEELGYTEEDHGLFIYDSEIHVSVNPEI